MTVSAKLRDLLDAEEITYEVLHHSQAFTAPEIAGAQHIKGEKMLKAVIIKAEGKYWMCVLPAIHMIDFNKLKKNMNMGDALLATEEETGQLFPDYEVGAEPPFGKIYGLPVLIDDAIQNIESVYFNAGSHTDVIKMTRSDYLRLAEPDAIADFGKRI